MITKTLNLDDAYQALFDEVREKSEGAINVTNLQAFFGSIEEIAALDPKFLRLPLDEPLFEIDANTRKISVPAEFKANGVSVQKDHLAEIIFFRIERYFDYTDLSTCNIEINWKMGSQEGKTTRFIKFDDVMTLPDETKSDCIIFGWPINNIVTEKSGTLTFAIEFNKTEGVGDEQEVIYRFNTLPIAVNIKEGLVISEDVEAVSLDTDILRTLVNSSFGEGTAAVGDVRWLTGDGKGLVAGEGLEPNIILKDFVDTLNLNTSVAAGIPSSDIVSLYANAFVDNYTLVRYTDGNNNQINPIMLKVTRPRVEAEYDPNSNKLYYASMTAEEPLSAQEIENAEELWVVDDLDENLRYFKAIDGEAFEEAATEDLEKWGTANAIELFIQVAQINVSNSGSYLIKAQGYKVDTNGEKIGNGEVKATEVVTVPAVEAPSEIALTLSERPETNAGYSYDEDVEDVVFLNNGIGSITAEAIGDNIGAVQFTWKKKIGEESDFSNIAENEVAFQLENESELEVNEAGQYQVSVVNFINGASAEPVDSVVITVSALAGAIVNVPMKYVRGTTTGTVTPGADVRYNSANTNQFQRSLTLKADVENIVIDGQTGEFEYQWYKEVTSFNENEEEVRSYEAIPGANAAELQINGGSGYFVLDVKNNYNGSVYTYRVDTINVVDNAGA